MVSKSKQLIFQWNKANKSRFDDFYFDSLNEKVKDSLINSGDIYLYGLNKTENKVLIANARRKYAAGEIRESCNYYKQAKINGYKAHNLRWNLKLRLITDPICFLF